MFTIRTTAVRASAGKWGGTRAELANFRRRERGASAATRRSALHCLPFAARGMPRARSPPVHQLDAQPQSRCLQRVRSL